MFGHLISHELSVTTLNLVPCISFVASYTQEKGSSVNYSWPTHYKRYLWITPRLPLLLNFFFNLHLNHTKRKVKTVLGNHKSAPNTWTFQFEWHLQSLDSFFLFWYVFLVISGEKKKFIKLQYFFQEKAHKDVIVTVMLFLLLLLFIATQRVRSLTGGKCHIF